LSKLSFATSSRARLSTFSAVELEEITNALEAFKGEVVAGASVGKLPYARLVKE
jgi:hypothetical protein